MLGRVLNEFFTFSNWIGKGNKETAIPSVYAESVPIYTPEGELFHHQIHEQHSHQVPAVALGSLPEAEVYHLANDRPRSNDKQPLQHHYNTRKIVNSTDDAVAVTVTDSEGTGEMQSVGNKEWTLDRSESFSSYRPRTNSASNSASGSNQVRRRHSREQQQQHESNKRIVLTHPIFFDA